MRNTPLKKVPIKRHGKVIISNHEIEDHERETIFCLSSFGLDVETVVPSHTPGSKNPDLLMMGTYWEMKGPRTANVSTITNKFRKAVRQSGGKAVFDLRNTKDDAATIEKYIMQLFESTRGMRRIIIIRKDDDAVDIIK